MAETSYAVVPFRLLMQLWHVLSKATWLETGQMHETTPASVKLEHSVEVIVRVTQRLFCCQTVCTLTRHGHRDVVACIDTA